MAARLRYSRHVAAGSGYMLWPDAQMVAGNRRIGWSFFKAGRPGAEYQYFEASRYLVEHFGVLSLHWHRGCCGHMGLQLVHGVARRSDDDGRIMGEHLLGRPDSRPAARGYRRWVRS